MEVRRGFKKTQVGVIPCDWNPDYIENFAQITTGSKNTQDRIDDGQYPFFVRSQTVERINSYSFDGEAVLTAGDGVGTGKVFHYINAKFDVHQRVYRISNFSNEVNGFYFYLYFSTHFYNRIMQMTAKSSVDSVRREMIARMLVPLPPTEVEQRAIATALSDVDSLVSGLNRLIAKKRDLKQAAMQQLLRGDKRLPGFQGGWELKPLADLIDFTNGKPHEKDIDPMGRLLLITLDSIGIDGKLKGEHRPIASWDNSLAKNDIVIILSDLAHGNLLGLCDLIPEDNKYVLNQRVGRLRLKPEVEANPQFLRLQINRHQRHFKKRGQGTSQRHIYRRDIDQLHVEVPEPSEQDAISEVLSHMDAELAALEQRLEKTRNLKHAMMQELLTGRTRLV